MNKKNEEAIREATAKALAAQVRRTLDVARVQGWEFPDQCDVGLQIVATTPLVIKVVARIDTFVVDANISNASAARDISKIVDALVAQWLAEKATKKPAKRAH